MVAVVLVDHLSAGKELQKPKIVAVWHLVLRVTGRGEVQGRLRVHQPFHEEIHTCQVHSLFVQQEIEGCRCVGVRTCEKVGKR